LNQRYKSSSLEAAQTESRGSLHPEVYPFDEDGNAGAEVVKFPAVDPDDPSYNLETTPVLLNAKEHAVGYLSRILNARVYEAAIETELQHAKNLSAVRVHNVALSSLILEMNKEFLTFLLYGLIL
jgi:hypothetical protein